MNRKFATISISLAAALALAGCTVNIGTSDEKGMMDGGGMMNQSDSDSGFSNQDIMFAQMMIPHHQQAVDMGTLAETRALSPEVKKLAAQIKAEQAPEIVQMQGWLKAANVNTGMGHSMEMGMLSDEQMQELTDATGAEFDKIYLQGMIAHHQGAIQMAKMIENSKNAEVAKLGKAIIDSQTKQISYMESLLKK